VQACTVPRETLLCTLVDRGPDNQANFGHLPQRDERRPLDAPRRIAHTPAVDGGPLTLVELEDRAAIHDLVMRYARAVDRRDFAAVAACFTRDAAYRGMLSQRDVADALRELGSSLARYHTTQHFMGTQLVELRGDDASCATYAIAHHFHDAEDGQRELTVAVVYEDELARREGAWLIRRRTARTLWVRDTRVGEAGDGPRDDA
jgi:ketosteroid isomerase-like protein